MFCESCGAPVTGAFCTRCGARAAQPSSLQPASTAPAPPPQAQYAPPPPASYAQPLAPAAKSGAGLKIFLVVLSVIALLGVLFIGGLWFAWRAVKQTAASKGLDFSAISEAPRTPGRRVDACQILPKEELSQILGYKVDRSESTGTGTNSKCTYFSLEAVDKAGDSAPAFGEALRKAMGNGSSNQPVNAEEAAKAIGGGVRSMMAIDSNGQIVIVEIETATARKAMAAFKLVVGGMAALAGGKKEVPGIREDIAGLGDEAIVGPLATMFMVRKGDVAVTINAAGLVAGKEAEIAIAKQVLARL